MTSILFDSQGNEVTFRFRLSASLTLEPEVVITLDLSVLGGAVRRFIDSHSSSPKCSFDSPRDVCLHQTRCRTKHLSTRQGTCGDDKITCKVPTAPLPQSVLATRLAGIQPFPTLPPHPLFLCSLLHTRWVFTDMLSYRLEISWLVLSLTKSISTLDRNCSLLPRLSGLVLKRLHARSVKNAVIFFTCRDEAYVGSDHHRVSSVGFKHGLVNGP